MHDVAIQLLMKTGTPVGTCFETVPANLKVTMEALCYLFVQPNLATDTPRSSSMVK